MIIVIDYSIFMTMIDHIGHDKRGNTIFKRDEKGKVIMMEKEETIAEKDSAGNVVYRKETRQVNGVNDQTILAADIFA